MSDFLKMNYYFDEFLKKSKSGGDRPNTQISKANSVKRLKPYFGEDFPNDVTSERWLLYLGAEARNINLFNLTKHFRAICKNLHEVGVMVNKPKIFNPNRKKEEVARRRSKNRIFTQSDISRMDGCCDEDQRLCLWLGYTMAFRMDDCLRLTWDRIDFGKRFIEFFGDDNKTEFVGKVPISDKVLELLSNRPQGDGLILNGKTSQQMKFKAVTTAANVFSGTFHTLRHTRLTEDFGNPDLPQAMVCKIRRVSLAVALAHYIHPSDSDMEKFRNTGKVK